MPGEDSGPLSVGSTAPTFTLPGVRIDDESGIKEYRLATELESHPVLLNFYMFDFHPECTTHLCTLHDLSWFNLDADIGVFGISTDSAFSHRVFARQETLEYPLLSDDGGRTAESYGVLSDGLHGHACVADRAVFVIDRSRTVRYAWVADEPGIQPEWEAIKQAIEETK